MTPHPLSHLDELESRQRHPAGRGRTFCPQTGRSLPRRIPATPRPRWWERLVLPALAVASCGIYVWLIGTVFSGGAL